MAAATTLSMLVLKCGPSASVGGMYNDAGTDVVGDAAVEVPDSDASGDGATDAPIDLPCDITKSPSEDPCVIDDQVGVFVNGTVGEDTNPGTKAEYPFKTYGGFFDCSLWIYATTGKAHVKPASGVAPPVRDLFAGLTVEDMAFESVDGVAPGDSSIAAFVTTSENVTFMRVTFTAGKGVSQGKAAAGSNYSGLAPSGKAPTGATGGAGGPNTCTNGDTSKGGSGGNGATGQDAGGEWFVEPDGNGEHCRRRRHRRQRRHSVMWNQPRPRRQRSTRHRSGGCDTLGNAGCERVERLWWSCGWNRWLRPRWRRRWWGDWTSGRWRRRRCWWLRWWGRCCRGCGRVKLRPA